MTVARAPSLRTLKPTSPGAQSPKPEAESLSAIPPATIDDGC